MIVISATDASLLYFLALYPKGNEDLLEKLEWDAQRIGDILIGRAIPVLDKLRPHHEAAKRLKEWAVNRRLCPVTKEDL